MSMKVNEAAVLLQRSNEQVRLYIKQGLLTATKNGRELLLDRNEVIKFAQSRGINALDREVPQGANFTDPFPLLELVARRLPEGVTINLTNPQATAKV